MEKHMLNESSAAAPSPAPPPAPSSDAVQVPRELLERIANDDLGMASFGDFEELRALLNGGRV